ncbi:hypothetical protein KIH74_25080 [Kineosporia sp. J2-2]|uniref:GH26 domain-containing protein n=1 Tax=Kineosporia corallincola TaxID=2835133 RepID=A0ABS5TQD0_9ACTN|nr:glycosyl hydrolase [Kineosporia corallincola]MBT0772243.1 hypothetical protein [Kineosporia corallincola]
MPEYHPDRRPPSSRRPSFHDLVPENERHPAPQRSFREVRARRSRLPWIAAVLALLVVAGGVGIALRPHDEPRRATGATGVTASAPPADTGEQAPAAPRKTTGAEKNVSLAVFRSASPASVGQFSDWLGRDVDYVVDFSRRLSWDQIANPIDHLSLWRNSGYRVVYGVAMLPEARSDTSTIAAGARGEYDQYYRTLAQNLVRYGQGDAILRLGWEFNVANSTWHPDDPQEFITYWRNIVRTMRAVPGAQNLEFDWNVNSGGDSYDSTVFYPGDKYVDYVGVDVYDIAWADGTYPYPTGCGAPCRRQRQEAAWKAALNARFGLIFWSDFAEARGKPMSFPEWGLWDRPDGQGGGDNPYFIEQMHDFIDNPHNNVAYHAYFDYDVGEKGDHRLASFPKAGKKFARLFGEQT